MLPMSMPAAAALTSMPGSIGGSNSASGRTTPCDVHAVADLEQPVGDRVPVAEQLVVARDAEVERAPDAEQRRRCRRRSVPSRGRPRLNGNWPSSSTSALPIGPSPSALSWAKVLARTVPRGGIRCGRGAEEVGGQHVELRRLVDRSRPCPAGTGGRPRRSGCPGTSSPRCTGRRGGACARPRAAGTACCESRRSRSAISSCRLLLVRRQLHRASLMPRRDLVVGRPRLAEGEELPETLRRCSAVLRRSRSDRRCSGTSAAPRRTAGSCSGAPRRSAGCGRTAPSCSWRTGRCSVTSISLWEGFDL